MAYSMFERPKLQNAKSMKFYPQEYDHHVSFRHKNVSPDFDLTIENHTSANLRTHKEDKGNYSIEAQTSTYGKKCPIYVHNYHQNGDYVLKSDKHKKSKSKHKAVMEKLEESYWANWKPDKSPMKSSKSPEIPVFNTRDPEIQVIKSAPERRRKIKVYPRESPADVTIPKNLGISQEIQTDDVPPIIIPQNEEIFTQEETPFDKTLDQDITSIENESIKLGASDEPADNKFLKHTDSMILNIKKQKEEKERFEQPKCIRLYKKTGKTTKNYMKGGSYPLKSCLKKDTNVTKGSTKLARPGSPMIVSSSYSNKHKTRRR